MAQRTRTWSDLVNVAQSRIGLTLEGEDLTRLGWLLNSAASILYEDNPYWERWLVLEPRTVERGYIAYDEDSYNVYGAGTSEVNGLYVRNGNSLDGAPAYTLYDTDGVTELYNLYRAASLVWAITDGPFDGSGTPYYTNLNSPQDTPPELGWGATGDGEEPAPIVQATSEIGEYIGHWNGAVFTCSGSTAGTAYPDQNGIRVTNCNHGDVAYVAFKKSHIDIYGDGTEGTVSDIPSEFFEFMAMHAARSWKASQGEQSIALADVQTVKDQALLKISRQGINDNIARRFRTYYGQDVSVR